MTKTFGAKVVAESVVFEPQSSFPIEAEGKTFYDNTEKLLWYYDGAVWRRILPDV